MCSEILPRVSPDQESIIFKITLCDSQVECEVSRTALEQWFWLPPTASNERMLRAYMNGANRIAAVATRKARKLSALRGRVTLASKDFRPSRLD